MRQPRVFVAAPFKGSAIEDGLEGVAGIQLDYEPDLPGRQRIAAEHEVDRFRGN